MSMGKWGRVVAAGSCVALGLALMAGPRASAQGQKAGGAKKTAAPPGTLKKVTKTGLKTDTEAGDLQARGKIPKAASSGNEPGTLKESAAKRAAPGTLKKVTKTGTTGTAPNASKAELHLDDKTGVKASTRRTARRGGPAGAIAKGNDMMPSDVAGRRGAPPGPAGKAATRQNDMGVSVKAPATSRGAATAAPQTQKATKQKQK